MSFIQWRFWIVAVIASQLSSSLLWGESNTVASWDLLALKRLDFTNKAYVIASDGTVVVHLANTVDLCPSGLGHLASEQATVREIQLHFDSLVAAEYGLRIIWNPGGSGKEQFEVLANEKSVGKTPIRDGAIEPYHDDESFFKFCAGPGKNLLALRYLSGDGLQIKNIVLYPAKSAGNQTLELSLNPGSHCPSLEAYEAAIGEPGILLQTDHVFLFAPKKKIREAMDFYNHLKEADDPLHGAAITATNYKIIVFYQPAN